MRTDDSGEELDDKIRHSKVENLGRAVELLTEHADDLAAFLTGDERGRVLVPYLKELSGRLSDERQELLDETEILRARVEHIKRIVSNQQQYAKTAAAIETCSIDSLVKQAIDVVESSYDKHGIEIVLKCTRLPDVSVDRHLVMQILINLLSNAKHALIQSDQRSRRVRIDTDLQGDQRFYIRVSDNGVGILEANLKNIFSHGFTTKRDGHGFGLHNSCNAAKAMGGELSCRSDGHNRGTAFRLELPLRAEGGFDAPDGREDGLRDPC